MTTTLSVAIVQATPAFMNLPESVSIACRRIEEAAGGGAKLVAFPETWLPGYPVWIDSAPNAALWGHPPARRLHRRLLEQSLVIGDPAFTRLQESAKAAGCYVVMGCHERDGKSLYNSMVTIGPDGEHVVHRKLVPTYTERMVWGRGDGSTLGVLRGDGISVGGLICWEHWMPLARAALQDQGETVHVAQWPTVHDLHQLASRHYAFEGGCFVLAAGSVLTKSDALEGYRSLGEDAGIELLESIPGEGDQLLLGGGSSIYSPTAELLAEPRFGEEQLITAELDLGLIPEAGLTLDTTGHYSRPDVFQLRVNRNRQRNVETIEGEG